MPSSNLLSTEATASEQRSIEGAIGTYFQDVADGNFEGAAAATAPNMQAYANTGLLSGSVGTGESGFQSIVNNFNQWAGGLSSSSISSISGVVDAQLEAGAAGASLKATPWYVNVQMKGSKVAVATFLLAGTATPAGGSPQQIQWRVTQVWEFTTPLLRGADKWLLSHSHMSQAGGPKIFSF